MEVYKDTKYKNYEVSNTGKVRNKKTSRSMVTAIVNNYYWNIQWL